MAKYRCNVCNVFEYDDSRGDSPTDIKPGTSPDDFPDNWKCPICKSDIQNISSMYLQYKYNIPEICKTTIRKNYLKFADTCGI